MTSIQNIDPTDVEAWREVVNGQGMRVLPRQIPPGATRRRAFSEYYSLVSRSPGRHTVPGGG